MSEPAAASGWFATLNATLRGTFRFAGRSTRSELFTYALSAVFISLAVGLLLMIGLDYERYALAQDALQVLYCIPVPALLARRLHDQNRTGRFLWLAVPGVTLWTARKVVGLTQPLATRVAFDGWTWPLDVVSLFTTLALVIVTLLPGTVGPNRFGPDPRDREANGQD